MRRNDQGLVDLLEIYHARQLRDQLVHQLRRLRAHDPLNPYQDEDLRRDTCRYYETMLLTVADLLNGLGDRRPVA